MMVTEKTWMFTVDTDGVYTCDVYEGHSHPYPDPDLIACAKFCTTDGKIESIIYSLGDWEYFTEDKELQKEIELEPTSTFVNNSFYKEQIFPDEIVHPKRRSIMYGINYYMYGAIHIWKVPEKKTT
jgi:hypothetical protein